MPTAMPTVPILPRALDHDALCWQPEMPADEAPSPERVAVLLHYFGGTAISWQPVAERLAARGVTCVALDQPGFGAAPPLERYDVMAQSEAVRRRIAELLGEIGAQRYVLAGHSMGGKIALGVATLAGEGEAQTGPDALVLVAPSPPTYEPLGDDERARMLSYYPSRRNAEETVRGAVCGEAQEALSPDLFALALEMHGAAHPRAWRWWIEEGTRERIDQRTGRLTLPITLVASEDDPVIPLAHLEDDLIGPLPHTRQIILSQTGHLIPLEAPDAVADAIAQSF
jgi:pimeloyl-ACP methyl ester carboxylesterase